MGCHGAWAETSCIMPTGLLPERETCVGRVIDSERWSEAEKRVAELIARIQPNEGSRKRRKDIADYIQGLIGKCFSCQVYIFGSVPLMTYLPDGDIDLTVFSDDENLKDTWADKVYQVMKDDKKNENAEFHVKEVQLIKAEVKVIKCLVEGIVVDITFCQKGGIRALRLLEEMDNLINQDHLFKRSIILIKAWCYYESRILGAHHGLISTYALETMIIYIFHVFDNSFAGPFEVLYRFIELFSNFDWEKFCVSIWGPVPIQLLPDIAVIPPRKDNGEFYHEKSFLKSRTMFIDSLSCGQSCQRKSFASKYFNVVDPLCEHNNLGRSVYKGNFYRIRSAFAFGAEKLARLLNFPKEEMISELNLFFINTWGRHKAGLHNCATTSLENSKPYKSYNSRDISFKVQNDNISEDPGREHLADVGPSFYGASSQILRMINQNSAGISRRNGIRSAACNNAENEEVYRSGIIIKNQDYVEKSVDSAKPSRASKNHENLSYINSTNMEEGDCSAKACFRSHPSNLSEVSCGKNDNMDRKSDTHEAFRVSSEHGGSSKSLPSRIMSSQAVTSTDSNGASHSFHDIASSTIETSSSTTHSQHSYDEYPAQEIYRAPPKVGNFEVPINETALISDADHIVAAGQFRSSNSQQRAIANSVVVPATLYPTGPPVPFLEMLQTCGMFDRPEIHVATPAKPVLSHGLPSPNIPLLGPSPYPYHTVAPNVYFRRIFPLIRPIRSILPQGSQFLPPVRVLPEAQMRTSEMLSFGDGVVKHPGGIRTYPINPRGAPSDQSPATENCCISGSPQLFWFTNDPIHSERPSLITGTLNPNYSQTAGSFDLCRSKEINLAENSSIGSSSFSPVSTYVTQGMDSSQLFAAQPLLPSQHQRLMAQKNHQLQEEGHPPL